VNKMNLLAIYGLRFNYGDVVKVEGGSFANDVMWKQVGGVVPFLLGGPDFR
jgi:hypothetical protein